MDNIGHVILQLTLTFTIVTGSDVTTSGCADGSTEGFQDQLHPKIAACDGRWSGHVQNSSSLCARGWQVCSYREERLLKKISWNDATSIAGCYAFNAAQDGGQCQPCTTHLEQDDLAGVGRGCAHQSYGQQSCISGGQIAVSCCIDTHFNQACTYRPGLATGVLCCRLPGVPPQIVVEPQRTTHVKSGVTFVLSCQAMGSPTPVVTWFKDARPLPSNNSRIATFDSGYLLISEAIPDDTADYKCFVSNSVGSDEAVAKVMVTDYESGCGDGSTEGLYAYEEIQACKGTWVGHVKRSRGLCARGWQVCNPRHVDLLRMLTWEDASQLKGCYAYNAANVLNQCTRCHRDSMAGIGEDCGRQRRHQKSCLAQGRVDVYRRPDSKGCDFNARFISGVVCCKRQKKNDLESSEVAWWKPHRCSPKCTNGGRCVAPNQCACAQGYKGVWCQNPICPGGCIPNSQCYKPGMCRCLTGFTGPKCQSRERQCRPHCMHGGICRLGKCTCPATHHGSHCQHVVKWKQAADLNRTER